jgi:hypothetical protein
MLNALRALVSNGLTRSHYAAIGVFAAALATLVGTLGHGWQDMKNPYFVAGLLGAVAGLLKALGSDPPDNDGATKVNVRRLGTWFLIAAMGTASFGLSAGCAFRAATQPAPVVTEVQRTRATAQKIAAVVEKIALTAEAAQTAEFEFSDQTINGQPLISSAEHVKIQRAFKAFAIDLKEALETLRAVATRPALQTTIAAIDQAIDRLAHAFDDLGNPKIATALRTSAQSIKSTFAIAAALLA